MEAENIGKIAQLVISSPECAGQVIIGLLEIMGNVSMTCEWCIKQIDAGAVIEVKEVLGLMQNGVYAKAAQVIEGAALPDEEVPAEAAPTMEGNGTIH